MSCVFFKKQRAIPLYYRFLRGFSYRYRVTNNVKSIHSMMENKMSSITNTEMIIKEDVKQVSKDTVLIVFTIEDAYGVVETMGQKTEIPQIASLKNKKIEVYLYKGRVVNIKGIKGKDIIESFSSSYQFLPDDSLAYIGESWIKESKSEGREEFYTYTLTAIEDIKGYRCAVILYEGKIIEKGEKERMGIKANVEMTGIGKGKIYFAIDKGFLVKQEGTIEFSGEIEMMGKRIKTSTQITSVIEVVE